MAPRGFVFAFGVCTGLGLAGLAVLLQPESAATLPARGAEAAETAPEPEDRDDALLAELRGLRAEVGALSSEVAASRRRVASFQVLVQKMVVVGGEASTAGQPVGTIIPGPDGAPLLPKPAPGVRPGDSEAAVLALLGNPDYAHTYKYPGTPPTKDLRFYEQGLSVYLGVNGLVESVSLYGVGMNSDGHRGATLFEPGHSFHPQRWSYRGVEMGMTAHAAMERLGSPDGASGGDDEWSISYRELDLVLDLGPPPYYRVEVIRIGSQE